VSDQLVVSDTSPLQYLHQVGYLHLLPALFGRVLVPPIVAAELGVGLQRGIDLPVLAVLPWVVQQAPTAPPTFPGSATLDPGEREAIALALELHCRILIDEWDGRRIARNLGLSHTGTLGVLVAGKRHGLVPTVAPVLDRLVEGGYRMDMAVRIEALRRAGEVSP